MIFPYGNYIWYFIVEVILWDWGEDSRVSEAVIRYSMVVFIYQDTSF